MLKIENAIFVLIDVQGKLAELMHGKDALFENLQKMVRAMQVLRIPILWLEQNPLRMGPTIAPLAELLKNQSPVSKMAFSCCGEPEFLKALKASDRKQVLLAGIETHVCVYQTACHLTELGYEVEVVADAVSSRTSDNRDIALRKIESRGIRLTSVEMAIFELLGTAEHPAFKDILKIVK